MIAKYFVICDSDIKALIIEVETLIGKGWKPQGGICSAHGTKRPDTRDTNYLVNYEKFYQAMIFEIDD